MSRQIIEKIKQIKNYNGQVNPDRVWVTRNREQMMTQIKNTIPETKPKFDLEMIWQAVGIFIPNKIVYSVVRPLAVFVLVGTLATSGWIASVSATQNSLPGELGYSVKRATEKTQVAVASIISTEEVEAQMHMDLASKRAKEIKQVVVENKNNSTKNAQVAMVDLEKSIQTAGEKIKNVGETKPEKVLEVSKNVTEKTKEIKENLKNVEAQNNEIDINNVQKITSEISIGAVELVVKKKEEGKVVVSEEEVKKLVSDQIDIISSDANIVQQKAEVVAGQMVIVESSQTTSTAEITTSGVSMVAENTVSAKSLVEDTSKTVADNIQQTEKSLTEAKTLVESNHLLEAIQKVKEVTQANQETAQVVKETQKVVTEVQSQITQQNLINNTTTTVIGPTTSVVTTTVIGSTTPVVTTTVVEPTIGVRN